MIKAVVIASMLFSASVASAQLTASAPNPSAFGHGSLLLEGDSFPNFACNNALIYSTDPEDIITASVALEFMGRQVAVSDPQTAQGAVYVSVSWTPPSPNTFSGDTETTLACNVWGTSTSGRSGNDYKSVAWRHTKFAFATNYSFDQNFSGPPWHWIQNPGCQHRVANSGRWSDFWSVDTPFSLVATLTGYDHHLIVYSVIDNWFPWAFDFTQDLSVCSYLQVQ